MIKVIGVGGCGGNVINHIIASGAFEYGLVLGTSDTTFNPTGYITVAQAVTMAARVHSIYTTGSGDFTQGTPWYQMYVDYAAANGVLSFPSQYWPL